MGRTGCVTFLVLLAFVSCVSSQNSAHDDLSDIQGNYCRTRRPETCCPNRDDGCSVPILGTLCYCDMFCNRTRSADCCPDFWEHCMGISPPDPYVRPHCIHNGVRYNVGQTMMLNCNKCTCKQTSYNQYEFSCDEKACLVRPEMVQTINQADFGWKAANYSLFWGRTLAEGIRYRLGTYKPTRPTMSMNEIHIDRRVKLPENFDSRQRWPGLIQPIMDQGNCGSSWAISTTAVASDRLAIQSDGVERERLSPQHLISCQNRKQRGCEGGHLDRAWWYLRKKGVATEKCVPYESGNSSQVGSCKARRFHHEEVVCPGSGRREKLHFSTPPYRVAPQEELIMQEIFANGPVQATFTVHEDFFLYRYGVYRKVRLTENLPTDYRQSGYHSVRIIGWGVERSGGRPIKYWLCTNSWGRQWGEDGYFRIVRGENECDIEMFIVGVWGKRDDPGHRLRHTGLNDNRVDNDIRTRRL